MIYEEMRTEDEARINFSVYRVIRLLHDLKVVSDIELCAHEDAIHKMLPVGLHVDWYNYRILGPGRTFLQL